MTLVFKQRELDKDDYDKVIYAFLIKIFIIAGITLKAFILFFFAV